MVKRTRWLLQTVILSITLNIALVAIFFYFLVRENPLQFSFEPSYNDEEIQISFSPALLERLHTCSFSDLTELLEDKRPIEAGFRVCDFALGALVTFYDFDIERALGLGNLQRRISTFDETTFVLFPDLSEKHFASVLSFIQAERWPWTARGLLKAIEQEGIEDCSPTLLHQFCHTSEFVLLETLFARAQVPIQRGALLELLLNGGWEKFADFYERQKAKSNFSNEARRELLLECVADGIAPAVNLLLVTDFDYATRQLTDEQLCQVLDLLSDKTPEAFAFVQTISTAPRGSDVGERVSAYLGLPQKELRPVFRDRPPAAPPPGIHVIQSGESLWLIARKYHVSIEQIKQLNNLKTNVIQPGKTLKIPRV